MDIKEFKQIVAQNIYYLRTKNQMTQYELGEKLNYSDKAISKWERGDGLPDAYIISKMCELFGVSVDYMITPHSEQDRKVETKPIKKTKKIISKIVMSGIFTLALFTFVLLAICTDYKVFHWQVFVYAIPFAMITQIVFASVWHEAKGVFVWVSILLWSIITSVYLILGSFDLWKLWIIFVLGIPLQVIVFLAFRIKITIKVSKKPKKYETKVENDENIIKSK